MRSSGTCAAVAWTPCAVALARMACGKWNVRTFSDQKVVARLTWRLKAGVIYSILRSMSALLMGVRALCMTVFVLSSLAGANRPLATGTLHDARVMRSIRRTQAILTRSHGGKQTLRQPPKTNQKRRTVMVKAHTR